ncbi:FAD-dependent thymidylate synthase [Burkholderia pseudomallei]|uniref:FAD-dependent thymidylate synthase n=1 Tax=Burkholderia pseudomallei TaxID=28450 RepID=UPI0024DF3628|nr:FAD-dependent thymidylate synthase [Burkholderia pseudomallei]
MIKELHGKSNIIVKVIADSISGVDVRLTTFELTYPRMIHSELMTHRLFSRNAMSSRAVPIKTMIDLVRTAPAKPVEWGKNNAGMQSKSLLDPEMAQYVESEWETAAANAARSAALMDTYGAHKQIANRLLEPFQMMRTILTATDFANFFWLRVDADADPTIKEVATLMHELYKTHEPETLENGQWHTPYVDHYYDQNDDGTLTFAGYCVDNTPEDIELGAGPYKLLTQEEALGISASCCAQVSYRRLDSTKDKALSIYERLLSGNKVHASPFEHQATPMRETEDPMCSDDWDAGTTHVDINGERWSGNLREWVQHRQLLPNNVIGG